jgi:procollagen-lysine,2-oxoglutarate 5-dioxygenase, invertebrate
MGKKYLNAGVFIGYASELYELLKNATLLVRDDQEYFTKAYLNEQTRHSLRMGLDHRCEIFQTFESERNIVHLVYNGKIDKNAGKFPITCLITGSEVLIHNRDYDTYPPIVHGPGSCKPIVYALRNFLPRIWTPHEGCISCLENSKSLAKVLILCFAVVNKHI